MKEDVVSVEFPGDGKEVEGWLTFQNAIFDQWITYQFIQNFLAPTSAWTLTAGGDKLKPSIVENLSPGVEMVFKVNGHIQATGYIDSIEYNFSSTGGTEISIQGRDKFSPLVDANFDYRKKFPRDIDIGTFVQTIIEPFGFEVIATDNIWNKGVIQGSLRGNKTSEKGKILKKFTKHQLLPYPREGVHQFLSRVLNRDGYFIWCSADGEEFIIGKPDFDTPPPDGYHLKRSKTPNSTNNITHGTVKFDGANQPSAIVADGFAIGTTEFGKSKIITRMVNPITGFDEDGQVHPEISKELANFADAKEINLVVPTTYRRFVHHKPRVMYLHDNESKTQEQLDNFVRREMSLKMREAVECHYSVRGHTAPNGHVWAVDTMVQVDDDIANIHGPMYILERNFHKSRSGGTTTSLKLIPPQSLQL